MSTIPEDANIISVQVPKRCKSTAHIQLSKYLQEASGPCGINIVQNGNQIFFNKLGPVIRNQFYCQRLMLRKGSARDASMENRDYQMYTLHNNKKDQRSKDREQCQRGYSLWVIRQKQHMIFNINFDEFRFHVQPGLGM